MNIIRRMCNMTQFQNLGRNPLRYMKQEQRDICSGCDTSVLAASVSDEMYVNQIDVTSPYVQGKLHDEIYMKQPEMLIQNKQKDKVCKLLKPLWTKTVR